jgi:myo-inositol-1(or 4)-monophosphatase
MTADQWALTKQLLDVAEEAARAAGEVALGGFRGPLEVRSKGGKDIVTQYDMAAERAAIEVIRARYPTHGILAEEGGLAGPQAPSHDFLWMVDPIDGTHNYAAQLPFWCVSVAVGGPDGTPLAGVVLDPVHDELFSAIRGGGAFLNGSPIKVSSNGELSEAFVASDIGYRPGVARRMLFLATWVQPMVRRWRLLGSAVLAMAYVAAGRFDAYFHLSLQPWDLGAASLLVEEAGGLTTDWEGRPLGPLWQSVSQAPLISALVTNRLLHSRMQALLRDGLAKVDAGPEPYTLPL